MSGNEGWRRLESDVKKKVKEVVKKSTRGRKKTKIKATESNI